MRKFLANAVWFLWLFLFYLTGAANASGLAFAEEKPVNAYLFYSKTCPHCTKEVSFFNQYLEENPGKVELHSFEISKPENTKIFELVSSAVDQHGVPMLVVGEKVLVGYLNDETTGKQIDDLINECAENGCQDFLADLDSAKGSDSKLEHKTTPVKEINLPIFGKVNLSQMSLPVMTIILGLLDGFNPCAMWVLFLLIGLLLGMEDRKKMWILGLTFIITSGLVYLLFLVAWLKLFLFVGYVEWIKIVVGVVAIISGLVNLKNFREETIECKVSGEERKRKTLGRLEKITQTRKFWLALIGIVFLAVSVNLIELVCSAGLPAIFTQVLSLSKLSTLQYIFYLTLYIFLFMLDDLLVFFLAMKTLQVTGFNAKYSRFSHLIGGVVLLLVGVLLILKPELLMFG